MSDRIEVVRPARDVARWNRETEVLVVGLGCAGACAARGAAQAGAKVIVLERASGGGGTSAMSGGVLYLGGGTPIQKECGYEDSAEEMFKYLMASAGPKPDESKIRAYSDGSVEHYHWLVEQGVPFKAGYYAEYSGEPPNDVALVTSGSEYAYPFCEMAEPAPRGHCPQIDGAAGGFLMQKLCAAVDREPNIEVITDARTTLLVQNEDGAIEGVIAHKDGEELALTASGGVIVTTGGFINNDAMIDTNAPLVRKCSMRVGADGDDGSGIQMGLGAGASAIHLDCASISMPIIPPKAVTRAILVNEQGQRYTNEDLYYGRLGERTLYAQNGRCWLIMDDETFVRPDHGPTEPTAVAETVAELERDLGMPETSLQSTVDLYNRHARNGQDPLFRKAEKWITPLENPPFAAIAWCTDSALFAAFTLGGLQTDADSHVMTPAGETIPRLYAAGRASSGIAAPGYSSGLSLGDGSFFGRRAGQTAAAAARG
ncbi:MAG: FAD-dependent oxidoreductase [Myxococcota bacterium]|nr:FAD-dependent oxidoreductase [Myxococcota bacterium]